MKEARRFHAMAAHSGHLYVFGGRGSGGSISSAERYDPVADTWTDVASMPIGRYELCIRFY
jgi:kelch-like protein 17 (actinfilin)/kelch-like protein 20